jgi:hypothetical protein
MTEAQSGETERDIARHSGGNLIRPSSLSDKTASDFKRRLFGEIGIRDRSLPSRVEDEPARSAIDSHLQKDVPIVHKVAWNGGGFRLTGVDGLTSLTMTFDWAAQLMTWGER